MTTFILLTVAINTACISIWKVQAMIKVLILFFTGSMRVGGIGPHVP